MNQNTLLKGSGKTANISLKRARLQTLIEDQDVLVGLDRTGRCAPVFQMNCDAVAVRCVDQPLLDRSTSGHFDCHVTLAHYYDPSLATPYVVRTASVITGGSGRREVEEGQVNALSALCVDQPWATGRANCGRLDDGHTGQITGCRRWHWYSAMTRTELARTAGDYSQVKQWSTYMSDLRTRKANKLWD